MSRLRDVLRAADPLRFEPAPDEGRRIRARREALAARPASERREGQPQLARRVAMVVTVGAAATIVGLGLWQRGITSALAAVRFEIRLAENAAAPGLREAPVGSEPRLVYLYDAIVVSNDHVAAAQVVAGRNAERFGVEVLFTPEGARRMLEATSAHIGRPVALLVDGLVALAPTVRSAIGDRAMLTGDYTRAEAERIAAGILLR
jgi:hypothetical protein